MDQTVELVTNNVVEQKVSPDAIHFISNVISLTPSTMTAIEVAIISIIQDGKIDSKDIPQLIIVVQQIYQYIYSLKNAKFDFAQRCELTSTTLKYIIKMLVLERKIKINPDTQAQVLHDIDALIDSCIGLLRYAKTIKPPSCFKKMFK